MRLTIIFVYICVSLSACVTRTISVSKPVVVTSVEDSSQQRRQSQRTKRQVLKPQMRESSLYFDKGQATLSLRAMVFPVSKVDQLPAGDAALKESGREVVSSYQILIQARKNSGLMIDSIALKSPSRSFSLPVSSINSATGIGFYVDITGEQAARIRTDENSLLVFGYQGRIISAVIVQHQLSNLIESLQ